MPSFSFAGGAHGAIDPHAHMSPQSFVDDVRRGRFGQTVTIEPFKDIERIVVKSKVLGKDVFIRIRLVPLSCDPERRIRDMDRMGVERQILSVYPPMMLYTLDAGANRELAASLNDGMSALARAYPERFSCTATVPLQDPPAAAAELARAKKAGHIGVMIGSNVTGMNLHDPSLDVFWARVSELEMPVFIHPATVCGASDRLKEFHLENFIGNPLDTTIAVACLIFGGVLDRYPNLRFYLSHMGGYVPWIRGRWQHGYGVREEPKVHGAKDPEQYIGRFTCDTIIHNADCFAFAVKTLGADHVAYGTDFPADMANMQPALDIPGMSRLSPSDRDKVLWGTAKRLYRL